MPKESFGNTQVKELKFSNSEIMRIVLDYIETNHLDGYDFDYQKPIMGKFEDGLVFRFVQKNITQDKDMQK